MPGKRKTKVKRRRKNPVKRRIAKARTRGGRAIVKSIGLLFPDRMRCKMRTVSDAVSGTTNGNTLFTYLLNSFGNGTVGTNGVGPLVNGAGTYGLNYPSGLKSMLATPLAAGSIAPYSQYRIWGAKVEVKIVPTSIAQNNIPSTYIYCNACPSNTAINTSMSITQFSEQPHCKTWFVGQGVLNAQNTNLLGGLAQMNYVPPTQKWRISNPALMGVDKAAYSSGSFANQYNANVGVINSSYFCIQLSSDNPGTSYYNCIAYVRITSDVEFFDRNPQVSTVNL